MKNVLFILNFSSSFEGSFIRSINTLAEELQHNECKAVYLLPEKSRETEWAKKLIDSGTAVYFFKPSFWLSFKNTSIIKKIIKEHNIKIIHSHFANHWIHIPVFFSTLGKKDIDYIVHVHSEHKKRSSLYDRLAVFFTNATLYVSVSDSIKNSLAITGRKTVLLPNAVDFSRLDFVDKKIKKEDYISSPNQKIVFMFGGNLKSKGVDFVVRTLAEYDPEHKFKLLIAAADNKGAMRKYLDEICEDSSEWIRLLPPRNDIATYFSLADVFVSANRFQGCPYTMIECAYVGIPIIYCDVPGINELNIPWSVKINGDDSLSLYKAITEIVNEDSAETKAMGAESREYVINRFSLGSWVYEMINIYKNIDRI